MTAGYLAVGNPFESAGKAIRPPIRDVFARHVSLAPPRGNIWTYPVLTVGGGPNTRFPMRHMKNASQPAGGGYTARPTATSGGRMSGPSATTSSATTSPTTSRPSAPTVLATDEKEGGNRNPPVDRAGEHGAVLRRGGRRRSRSTGRSSVSPFGNDWFIEFELGPASFVSIADAARATIAGGSGKGSHPDVAGGRPGRNAVVAPRRGRRYEPDPATLGRERLLLSRPRGAPHRVLVGLHWRQGHLRYFYLQ